MKYSESNNLIKLYKKNVKSISNMVLDIENISFVSKTL